jgi:Zn finger protein HypA/HybF involved in hydrogenase expression
MGEPIAYIEQEVECHSCLLEFVTVLKIESISQREVNVECPDCGMNFGVPVEYKDIEKEIMKQGSSYGEEIKAQQSKTATESVDYQGLGTAKKCGNCKANLRNAICPECGSDVKLYVEPSFVVPKSLRNMFFLYFILGVVFVISLPISLFSGGGESSCCTMSGFVFASFGLASYTINKVRQIRKKGLAGCFWCGKKISPISKYCIYCGKGAMWYWSKKVYAVTFISIVLVLILILAIIAVVPAHVSIRNVENPSSTFGNSIDVTITLFNEWGSTATADEIEVKIYGTGLVTTTSMWFEDIPVRTESTMTITVSLSSNTAFSVNVDLFYKGDVEDSWPY